MKRTDVVIVTSAGGDDSRDGEVKLPPGEHELRLRVGAFAEPLTNVRVGSAGRRPYAARSESAANISRECRIVSAN